MSQVLSEQSVSVESFVALLRPESRRSRAHRQVVLGERFFQDPERSRSKAVEAEQFGLASVGDVRQLGDTDRSEGPRRWRSDLGKVIVRHVLMFACRPPLAPLAAATLISLGRTRVRIQDGELWVGQAHVPLRFVGEIEVIPRDGKRKALGPGLDPAAYLLHRAWVGPMLRVRLTDPEDPTPYWIFSTRRPEQLRRALLEPIA